MKKILLLFTILFMSVITTACINNYAIQELNNKAKAYIDKGDTETAICRLKSSLDLDDSIYQTHYNLAVAYINLERYDDALTELKKTLEINPEFFDAMYSVAVVKETIAYNNLQDDETLTEEQAVQFNQLAQEAIDAYNEYLVKHLKAEDTTEVNNKITELNAKIKSFTERFDLDKV